MLKVVNAWRNVFIDLRIVRDQVRNSALEIPLYWRKTIT